MTPAGRPCTIIKGTPVMNQPSFPQIKEEVSPEASHRYHHLLPPAPTSAWFHMRLPPADQLPRCRCRNPAPRLLPVTGGIPARRAPLFGSDLRRSLRHAGRTAEARHHRGLVFRHRSWRDRLGPHLPPLSAAFGGHSPGHPRLALAAKGTPPAGWRCTRVGLGGQTRRARPRQSAEHGPDTTLPRRHSL